MPDDRSLRSKEIDEGWRVDDASTHARGEPSDGGVDGARVPSSAFEQAYWEQVEGRRLAAGFGEVPTDFGVRVS